MPLHHYPSTGNRKEHDKFGQWYTQTLESYRRLFAEEPPSDIWPIPNTPQHESHSVRIDRSQHWVIQKPNWTRLTAAQVFPSLKAGWLSLLLGGLIFSGLGCAHNFSGFSSPLDWKGPDFLRFFVISWLVSLAIAIPLRRALRSPGPDEKESLPELDPFYELLTCVAGRSSLSMQDRKPGEQRHSQAARNRAPADARQSAR